MNKVGEETNVSPDIEAAVAKTSLIGRNCALFPSQPGDAGRAEPQLPFLGRR